MDTGRKYVIGGNFKSNGDLNSIKQLINETMNKLAFNENQVEVFVAPTSIHIASVKALINQNISVAAQNMSLTGNGAFTGEISGEMLADFDVKTVLVGHSERRSLYGETNEQVAGKVKRAQDLGIKAVVCIGETLEQREGGTTNDVLKEQLDAIKSSITDWSKIVLAYEPVWAIGTGKTATPEIAEETHKFIRQWLNQNCGEAIANSIRIQYGGSVNAKNAPQLIAQPNIDGFLVGGASLKPEFADIVKAA